MEEIDDRFGRAMLGNLLGFVALARGRISEAVERFDVSLPTARSIGDLLGEGTALNLLGWARVLAGDLGGARACFAEQLLISSSVGHEEGVAYGLEGMVALAARSGDVELAGRLLGAAEGIRERKGLLGGTMFSFHQPIVEDIRSGPRAVAFEEARMAGRAAEVAEVVEEALA